MSAYRTKLAVRCRNAVLLLTDALALDDHCPEVAPLLWRRLAESQIDWSLEEVEKMARDWNLMETNDE